MQSSLPNQPGHTGNHTPVQPLFQSPLQSQFRPITPLPQQPAKPGRTDSDLILDYAAWLYQRGKSSRTRSIYLGTLRTFRAWLDQRHQVVLLDATRDQVRQWRAELVGVSDTTVLCYVTHIRSFYRWATREELTILPDPTVGVPVPRRPRRRPHPIGEADLELAIDTAPLRIRPWLVLAGYAGLRACEIALLHSTYVFVGDNPPYMTVLGKGDKERAIPLSPYVLNELTPILPRRGWVFLRRDGKPGHVSYKSVTSLCNEHLRDCGIQATLHHARHRFGTQAQRATRDLRVTQSLMGHDDPKTTAGYTEPSDPLALAAVLGVQPQGRRLRAARQVYRSI